MLAPYPHNLGSWVPRPLGVASPQGGEEGALGSRQTDKQGEAPPATWRRSSGTMAGSAVPGGNCRQTNLKR